jgi:hypothetical protein
MSLYPGPAIYPGPGIYTAAAATFQPSTGTGTPYLSLVFTDLAAGTNTITVFRIVQNRVLPVRAAISRSAVGGAAVVDYEAPFGVDIVYRAEMYDVDGFSLGFTKDFPARLDIADTWVHNPLDPAGGVKVLPEQSAAKTLTRPVASSVQYPIGRGIGVALSNQRRGLTDVDLSFITFTDADADKAQALFGNPYDEYSLPPVVCFRAGAGRKMRLPQPLFAVCDVVEVPFNTAQGGSSIVWQVTGQEVTPPAPSIVAAAYGLDDLDATYPTLADLNTAYLTLLDIDRDYGLSGAA